MCGGESWIGRTLLLYCGVDGVTPAKEALHQAGAEAAGGVHHAHGVRWRVNHCRSHGKREGNLCLRREEERGERGEILPVLSEEWEGGHVNE